VSIALLPRHSDDRPGLVISDACVRTVREIEGYVWRDVRGVVHEAPDPNVPDHCMDALRYAVMELTKVV
jgi:hypothetical protein